MSPSSFQTFKSNNGPNGLVDGKVVSGTNGERGSLTYPFESLSLSSRFSSHSTIFSSLFGTSIDLSCHVCMASSSLVGPPGCGGSDDAFKARTNSCAEMAMTGTRLEDLAWSEKRE